MRRTRDPTFYQESWDDSLSLKTFCFVFLWGVQHLLFFYQQCKLVKKRTEAKYFPHSKCWGMLSVKNKLQRYSFACFARDSQFIIINSILLFQSFSPIAVGLKSPNFYWACKERTFQAKIRNENLEISLTITRSDHVVCVEFGYFQWKVYLKCIKM